MKRILPQQFLPQQFLPQQFLPLLLLGLIGCSAGPVAKNTTGAATTSPATSSPTASVVPSPTSTAAVTKATSAATTSATTVPTTQPSIAAPAEVPAAVESEPKAAQTEPVDDPAQRTARIERARQMDKEGTVFRNQNWTITVGGTWSGVNGEGDLTYEGCDVNGKCLTLQGGTASCRDGVCAQGWQNGDYSYSLSAPIVAEGQPTPSSTLRVYQGDRLILEETGLKPVR